MRYVATLFISWEPALSTLMAQVGDKEEVKKNIFTYEQWVLSINMKTKKLIICYFGTSTNE